MSTRVLRVPRGTRSSKSTTVGTKSKSVIHTRLGSPARPRGSLRKPRVSHPRLIPLTTALRFTQTFLGPAMQMPSATRGFAFPVHDFPARGLDNDGVQCYANTAMQLLLACSGFLTDVRHTLRVMARTQTTSSTQGPLALALASLLTTLARSTSPVLLKRFLTPSLLSSVAIATQSFQFAELLNAGRQEDAQEWLLQFLDVLASTKVVNTGGLFTSWSEVRTVCASCKRWGQPKVEGQVGAMVPLLSTAHAQNVQRLLQAHFGSEEVITDYQCTLCGSRGRAVRHTALATPSPGRRRPLPPFLLVRLNRERFDPVKQVLDVIRTAVVTPAVITVLGYSYSLRAAAYKSGSAGAGHWVMARCVRDTWFLCNDARVAPVPTADITLAPSPLVTMVLYERL